MLFVSIITFSIIYIHFHACLLLLYLLFITISSFTSLSVELITVWATVLQILHVLLTYKLEDVADVLLILILIDFSHFSLLFTTLLGSLTSSWYFHLGNGKLKFPLSSFRCAIFQHIQLMQLEKRVLKCILFATSCPRTDTSKSIPLIYV